jgi:hypothetical protein
VLVLALHSSRYESVAFLTPALRRLRKEDGQFEVSLGYIKKTPPQKNLKQ